MPSDSVIIAGVRYPLARQKDGTPVYSISPSQFFPVQSTAEEVTEAAFPPEHRQPYSFRDLSGGAGQADVPLVGGNHSYSQVGDALGEGVDTTLTPDGPILLSAEMTTESLTQDGQYVGVFRPPGVTYVIFSLGQYLYSWDGTTVTALTAPTDRIKEPLVAYRGAQSTDYWYAVRGGTGPLDNTAVPMHYSTDSATTWTQVTTTGGIGSVRSLVIHDGEAVVAQLSPRTGRNTMIASFDDGGTTPTAYGVIDPVGDPVYHIQRLISFAGRIFVIKDGEGLFVLDAGRRTLSQELIPDLRGETIFFAGARVWHNILWLPTTRGLYAIGPELTIQDVSPTRNESNLGPFSSNRGVVTSVAGDAFHLYGFRGTTSAFENKTAFLQKAVVDIAGGTIRSIVWHDFLRFLFGDACYAMDVAQVGGGTSKINHLMIGRQPLTGSTFSHLRLPSGSPDPRSNGDYRYCAAGTLYYSRQMARFPQANKVFFGMTLLCSDLGRKTDGVTATSAQSVTPRYKLDTTALTASTPFGYTVGTAQSTGTGSKESFTVRGKGLDMALRLVSSDNTTSPQVSALTTEYAVEPVPLFQHRMTLDISAGALLAEGSTTPSPMPPGAALATLRALPASGTMQLVDPWGNEYTVTIPLTGVAVRAGGPAEAAGSQELPLLVDVLANEQ